MKTAKKIKKQMERNLARGKSILLRPEKIGFGDFSYKQIKSKDDMNEALDFLLRTGKFRRYASKTVINNVYMNGPVIFGCPYICRTKSLIDRLILRIKAGFRARSIDFDNSSIITETIRVYLKYCGDNKEKYSFRYGENITYAFPLSESSLYSIFILSEELRKNVSDEIIAESGLSGEFGRIIRGENVKEVFFKALLFDDIKNEDDYFIVNMRSILILK